MFRKTVINTCGPRRGLQPVVCLASLVLAALVWNLPAVGNDDLVSISPREEQGKRTIKIGFRPGGGSESRIQPAIQDGLSPVGNENSASKANLDVEEVVQRYPDGKTQIIRHVMQDAEGNFRNQGSWQLYNRRGQVIAEGQFENGLMQGAWSRWHAADDANISEILGGMEAQGPFLSVAHFGGGKLDGTWSIFDSLNRKVFEMSYTQGVRNGIASWWAADGHTVRQVPFERGLLHGSLVEYDRNQQPIRQTTFVEGRRLYTNTTWYRQEQKKTEDSFLDVVLQLDGEDDWWTARPATYQSVGDAYRQGPTRAWYENGQPRMAGQYRENFREGKFTWWHPNGQRQLVGTYAGNLKTGEWTWWHANGMKAAQGSYELGRPVGQWTFWDAEGQVIQRSDLTNSQIEEITALDVEDSPIEEIEPPAGSTIPTREPLPAIETEPLDDISLNAGK